MGEGTDHVKEIAQEIDELRDEMTPLITELDRRRRDALDWRLQVRQHMLPVSVAALAIARTAATTAASIVVRKAVERYVAAARTAAPAPAVT